MRNQNVTVIGLGQMGSALVAPLLDAGMRVTVWNRNGAKARPAVAAGAVLAPSLLAAVAASDLVIVCVADYAVSRGLFEPPEAQAALRGKSLIQLTTGNPAEARHGAAWARDAGIDYLEGAIMDYPRQIGRPECLLLVSGDAMLYARHAMVLKLLGGRVTHVGADASAANVLDGGLLTIYYAATFGFLQSAAMLLAEQTSPAILEHAWQRFRPVIDSSFARCADLIGKHDYSGNEASIQVHSAGVTSLLQRAKAAGVENRLLALFSEYLAQAIDDGHADAELPAVFEQFGAPGGA